MVDTHGVTFLYPTGNKTFYYLDTVNVSYVSPFATPLMYTFCDKGDRFSRHPDLARSPADGRSNRANLTLICSSRTARRTTEWLDSRPPQLYVDDTVLLRSSTVDGGRTWSQ
jgi:hypothetical protein